jgi:hypothetical protein
VSNPYLDFKKSVRRIHLENEGRPDRDHAYVYGYNAPDDDAWMYPKPRYEQELRDACLMGRADRKADDEG